MVVADIPIPDVLVSPPVLAVPAPADVARIRDMPVECCRGAHIASMSHEMRTPLNAVLALSQLMRDDQNLTDRQRTYVRTIERSGQHLLSLVEDIVDLAKAGAGSFELVDEPVELDRLVRFVETLIRPKADEKKLAFDCSAPFGLPRAVLTDGKRLGQVLLNLLGNAVKFTDEGSVGLAVHAHPRPESRVALSFVVSDSGVGLAPEHQARIFQPFVQVGDARRRASGSGLGLAISQQIVTLMGGQIRVESALGQGSRFRFDVEMELFPPVVT